MNWLEKDIKKWKRHWEKLANENERRMAQKKVKEAKILSRLPPCDFEPCSVCGNKPELEVSLTNGTFRVDVRCKKCDWGNGCYLNSYRENEIPAKPLMNDHATTWAEHWHIVNEWEKDEYDKFNSNDWKYKCAGCGEKRRGYDIESFAVLDGKYYCKNCLPYSPYMKHQREGNTIHYRSFADILAVHGGTINDYVRSCE